MRRIAVVLALLVSVIAAPAALGSVERQTPASGAQTPASPSESLRAAARAGGSGPSTLAAYDRARRLLLAPVTFTGAGHEPLTFLAQVAADPPSRQRGLMHRTRLLPDEGMLFVFPEDTDGGFWMKDTHIPLSIAFLDVDGAVLRIMDMEPCEADPCPTYRPGVAYRYALEVNQGAIAAVDDGWRVVLPDDLPPAT
jgi:uncharacterized membrane protein (UPF0127 family)